MLPSRVKIQPYATYQVSAMEALDSPSTVFEAEANWFISGHSAKVSANYRSRPIFEAQPSGEVQQTARASEVIVQSQVAI